MKYLFFLFILLNSPSFISAQPTPPKDIFYLGAGLSLGNYTGSKVAFNYIYRQKYSMQIGYSYLSRDATNLPANFEEIGFIGDSPKDKQRSWGILIGKVIVLDAKKNTRINFKIGVGQSIIKKPRNFQIALFLTPSQYIFHIARTSAKTFIVDTTLEFPGSKLFGLSIGSFLEINKLEISGGIRLAIMLGMVQ